MNEIGMDVVALLGGERVEGRIVAMTGCTPCSKKYQVKRHDTHELVWVRGNQIVEWIYPEDWSGPIII